MPGPIPHVNSPSSDIANLHYVALGNDLGTIGIPYIDENGNFTHLTGEIGQDWHDFTSGATYEALGFETLIMLSDIWGAVATKNAPIKTVFGGVQFGSGVVALGGGTLA